MTTTIRAATIAHRAARAAVCANGDNSEAAFDVAYLAAYDAACDTAAYGAFDAALDAAMDALDAAYMAIAPVSALAETL